MEYYIIIPSTPFGVKGTLSHWTLSRTISKSASSKAGGGVNMDKYDELGSLTHKKCRFAQPTFP